MPRNRKLFVHGTMVEICFRAEEGLPLPASPIIKTIFLSMLARAQSLYHFTICHYVIMANHPHILGVVEDPARVPDLVKYIKRESSHAVNRLLGRKQHTVWHDGYDSPIILDLSKAIERITYAYLNAQRANLERTIDEYPHCTSWQAFLDGGQELYPHRIPRNAITKLPSLKMTLAEQEAYARELELSGMEECSLFIDPDAWMACFDDAATADPEQLNELIIRSVRQEEQQLDRTRETPVLGAQALQLQEINKPHTPKKHGRRMICLSSSRELRKAYLQFYRDLCAQAPKFSHGFETKDWLNRLPPGLFAPGGALSGSIVPWIVPTENTMLVYS